MPRSVRLSVCPTTLNFLFFECADEILFFFVFLLEWHPSQKKTTKKWISVGGRSNGEGQVVCQVGRFGHNQKKNKCRITWKKKVDEKNFCFVFTLDWHQ